MSLFSTTPPVSKLKNVAAVIDWFSSGLRLYSTAKEKKSTGKIAYNESTNNGVYWFCKRELDA